MAKKSTLSKDIVKVILNHVRKPKGRLTRVSNSAHINRTKFRENTLLTMTLGQLFRLLNSLANESIRDCRHMLKEIRDLIDAYLEEVEEEDEDFDFNLNYNDYE